MQSITITTVLDENHEAVIKLPDLPPGPIKVTIERLSDDEQLTFPENMSGRDRLIAMGLYNPNIRYAPPDAVPLSDEERARLWKQAAGGKTGLELVNEEREERL
jgi:hypothetical protein